MEILRDKTGKTNLIGSFNGFLDLMRELHGEDFVTYLRNEIEWRDEEIEDLESDLKDWEEDTSRSEIIKEQLFDILNSDTGETAIENIKKLINY